MDTWFFETDFSLWHDACLYRVATAPGTEGGGNLDFTVGVLEERHRSPARRLARDGAKVTGFRQKGSFRRSSPQ